MKFTVIAFFITLMMSASAFSANLVSYFNSGENTYSEDGLAEDGFSTPAAICYNGEVQDVCAEVSQSEKNQIEIYSSGDHGYFKVNSCEVAGKVVFVNYQQINDYGDNNSINRVIAACNP